MLHCRLFVLVEVPGLVEARHVDGVIKVRDRGTKTLSELDSREDKHLFIFEFQNTDLKTSTVVLLQNAL